MTDRPPPPPPGPEREERRLLVTLHYPLDMGLVAEILISCGRAYPAAVVDEGGRVWSRRDG